MLSNDDGIVDPDPASVDSAETQGKSSLRVGTNRQCSSGGLILRTEIASVLCLVQYLCDANQESFIFENNTLVC